MSPHKIQLDVEAEWDKLTDDIGGRRVDSIVGNAPPFQNADYLYPAYCTIAELKCLDNDRRSDETAIAKASALYIEELKAGRASGIVFGTVELSTAGFSDEYTRKIISIYRTSLQTAVKKANDQIKATKTALNLPSHQGLLIVANNNHRALDPWHAHYLLNSLLQDESRYRSINAAIYLSANQRVIEPATHREVAVWIEVRRPTLRSLDEQFLAGLRHRWIGRLSVHRGEPHSFAHPMTVEELAELENTRS